MKRYLIKVFFLSLIMISSAYATDESAASFQVEEITHISNHGTTDHFSHLILKLVPQGYPINTVLIFHIDRPGFSKFDIFYLLINEDGDIVSLNDGFFRDRSPFYIVLDNPVLGEVILFSLSAMGNNDFNSYFNFTPYPIEIIGDNGHIINLIMTNAENGEFYYTANGFKKREDIQIIICGGFENEKIIFTKSIDGKCKGKLTDLFVNQGKYNHVEIRFIAENLDVR